MARRNCHVNPGHSVVFLPVFGSRYQLTQPPADQIAFDSRFWMPSLKRRCTSRRTSIVATLCARIDLSASTMYATCDSIMNTIDEWPSPVFGPTTMKKFGKPDTVVPR